MRHTNSIITIGRCRTTFLIATTKTTVEIAPWRSPSCRRSVSMVVSHGGDVLWRGLVPGRLSLRQPTARLEPGGPWLLSSNIRIKSTAAAAKPTEEDNGRNNGNNIIISTREAIKQAKKAARAVEEPTGHVRAVHVTQWKRMFDKLLAYMKQYGHCNVPFRYKCKDAEKTRLGAWVFVQRRNLALPDNDDNGVVAPHVVRRRQLLESIGFLWRIRELGRQVDPNTMHASAQDRFNARWYAMYERLKEYKAEYGHCRVPYLYNCSATGDDDGDDENRVVRLGNWVAQQRVVGTTDRLVTEHRRQLLDELGFVWNTKKPEVSRSSLSRRLKQRDNYMRAKWRAMWEDRYQRLLRYREEHGDCLVPVFHLDPDGVRLGVWVGTQRQVLGNYHCLDEHRRSLRPDFVRERYEKLKAIGFCFRAVRDATVEARWKRWYDELVAHHAQFGDGKVSYNAKSPLSRWVNKVRNVKRNKISRDQREQLEKLGFIWGNVGDYRWDTRFAQLEQFRQQHGHCITKRVDEADYPGLYWWVRNQRILRNRMVPERRAKLDAMPGFVWSELEAQWSAMYDQLRRYREEHGDCNVPVRYPGVPGLGAWVRTQRASRTNVTPAHRELLDALGFTWTKRTYVDTDWSEMYDRLRRYKEEHGDCNVPFRYPGIPSLGNWVKTQRSPRTKMTPEHRVLLDALGFRWTSLYVRKKKKETEQPTTEQEQPTTTIMATEG
jgi:hypothetical protein